MAGFMALTATVILVVWIGFALSVTKEDIVEITIAKRKNALAKVKSVSKEEKKKISELIKGGGDEDSKEAAGIRKKYAKKLKEAKKSLEKAEKGLPDIIDIMPACGYAALRRFGFDLNNRLFRELVQNFTRVDGKENAAVRAKHLAASTVSYLMIGLMIDAALVSIMISTGNDSAGTLGLIVLLLTVVLCYVPLSNLRQESQYREDRIESNFPNVVSKLAMLINSGMEVAKAWEVTAYSADDVLYEEMQTAVELQNNGVSPVSAYTQFMNNCNNKYTSKLATSIMQNLSKGNEEIGMLFMQMSSESWQERKHNSKRLGEKAQSGLLIPTIMIFGGLMVLIVVPIFASMGGAI
ncbi:MAG: type II secretion system F family protein [Ruminococcus sp.]|nr:type II secretion system F family protein [Ruminococcus sp.]